MRSPSQPGSHFNWWKNSIDYLLSVVIIACCLSGILIMVSMNNRANILVRDLNVLTALYRKHGERADVFLDHANAQKSEISVMAREISVMADEIREIRRNQLLLQIIAKRLDTSDFRYPIDHP